MYLFIATHLGSGASVIFDSLNKHPNVSCSYVHSTYHHPQDLNSLKTGPAKICCAKVMFNFQITSPSLYRVCKFIYVVRGSESLGHIDYATDCAYRYYCYRLRRLCEMAKHTPGALVITWEDIVSGRAFPSVQNYLGLKNPIISTYERSLDINKDYPYSLASKAQERYERHLGYLLDVLPK